MVPPARAVPRASAGPARPARPPATAPPDRERISPGPLAEAPGRPFFRLGASGFTRWQPKRKLFTVDAEIIVSHRYGAISIDGEVRSFMHQEVISGTLANYPEVVYEG